MFRVEIIFAGARADHRIASPKYGSMEEAQAEFRALNKQRLEAPLVERNWARLASDAVLAVCVVEE